MLDFQSNSTKSKTTTRKTFRLNHVSIAYTIASVAVAWAAVMTFAVVDSNDRDSAPVEITQPVAVVAPIADCEAQYAGWSRSAASLIETLTDRYDQGIPFNAQEVRGDNVIPMLERFDYIQRTCPAE